MINRQLQYLQPSGFRVFFYVFFDEILRQVFHAESTGFADDGFAVIDETDLPEDHDAVDVETDFSFLQISLVIDTEGKTPEEIVDIILNALQKN